MSEDEAPMECEKALEYTTHYADGFILQIGFDVCRLIFYEKLLEPNANGDGFETNTQPVRLKFEIRIPQQSFKDTVETTMNVLEWKDKAFRMMRSGRKNEIAEAWVKFDDRLGRIAIAPDLELPPDKELNALTDEYEDLTGKVYKLKRGLKHEHRKMPKVPRNPDQ